MLSAEEQRPVKLEFIVDINDQQKVTELRNILSNQNGIKNADINLDNKRVVVETTLQSSKVQNIIENSLKTDAVLMGAAVSAVVGKDSRVRGLVRFIQVEENTCVVDGSIDGLSPGEHGINIHEFGDLSSGCDSCGDHYNPFRKSHGGPTDSERHVGDLGNVVADEYGSARFRLLNRFVKVSDIIGRSFVVHANKDDYGLGDNYLSKMTGNSEPRLACGIIARSAGLFENTKRLCTCSGATIWEERKQAKAKEQIFSNRTSS
ncbi:unnamed protein product [Didymodactylos carnosus]|uniref:Superoxide dismutase copper/zinc binding domain-containing protein n=1 Tax=Didymodactylos carnosus TaxID=1234261 RepID=A0A8S2H6J6_9BILA|nr:unnamed protein product [Didymodactylos carnosus]CAF3607171.1 unnamed protein product [Didymodactylos carnosus]